MISIFWGLDGLDGTMNSQYRYIGNGQNVVVYILDTGANKHIDFDDKRLEVAGTTAGTFNEFQGCFGNVCDTTDCNGHGMHVIGSAIGYYSGVAKGASFGSYRLTTDCGKSTSSSPPIDLSPRPLTTSSSPPIGLSPLPEEEKQESVDVQIRDVV